MNVTSCCNPDKFVETYKDSPASLQEMMQMIPEDQSTIKYQQWKRVKLTNGKERHRVVKVQESRESFCSMIISTFKEFQCHIERVKQQYSRVKKMKEKLPKGQVLIQMDFSENYSCNALEEIQSAYWNNAMITLHPSVKYYKDTDDNLCHTSYVHVSEVLCHNAAMVMAIIDKLMKVVKEIEPELTCVHFWTDSPSSQYRNKSIFDLVSRFPEVYGSFDSWHFFQSGHGKGPCDGIGGTTKKNADNAVKQGKVLIQDAHDFFAWATQNEQGIRYELVTDEEYTNKKAEVDEKNMVIKPLKGSMQLHAVVGVANGRLAVRNTSCVCDECFNGTFIVKSICTWDECSIEVKRSHRNQQPNETSSIDDNNSPDGNDNEEERTDVEKNTENMKEIASLQVQVIDMDIEKFVVAKYDGKSSVEQVLEICEKDCTIHISFMVKCGKMKGR